MRINKIRINGFKSFVDSTSLNLPGNLTGIVGPNGCGKSNVIDALTWVLGETSAKQLRGDSMEDVIFNGSSTRQEVGKASVEILLDNSDGLIGDRYSSFSEISVKRELVRESSSNYSLNGVRCRRKDITDLFLGTGVGSRQYSVIGQGMVSRIIESKPEEMRGFLEEAAGISKYKERRRETENKIKLSRTNISRINDLRAELQTQLNKLDRQAREAKRYNKLREQEFVFQKKILAFRWSDLDSKRSNVSVAKMTVDNKLSNLRQKIFELDSEILSKKDISEEKLKALGDFQADFYKSGAEISRMEDNFRQTEKREAEATSEQTNIGDKIKELHHAISHSKEAIGKLNSEINEITSQVAAAKFTIEKNEALLTEKVEEGNHSGKKLLKINSECQQLEKELERLRLQIIHSRDNQSSNKDAVVSLDLELEEIKRNNPETILQKTQNSVIEHDSLRNELKIQREDIRREISKRRLEIEQRTYGLHENQRGLEEERGRYASLKTLQNAAHGDEGSELTTWISRLGIGDVKRLVETIKIEAGWEVAFERALLIPTSAYIKNRIVEELTKKTELFGSIPTDVTFVDEKEFDVPNKTSHKTMLSKIESAPSVIKAMATKVLIIDEKQTKEVVREALTPGLIAVSKDGTIFGPGWISVTNKDSAEANLLLREAKITELGKKLIESEAKIKQIHQLLTDSTRHLSDLHLQERATEDLLTEKEQQTITVKEKYLTLKAKNDQRTNRIEKINQERARIATLIDKEQTSELELTQLLERREGEVRESNENKEKFIALHETTEEQIEAFRLDLLTKRELAHSLEIQFQNLKAQKAAAQTSITQNEKQEKDLEERLQRISAVLAAGEETKQDDTERIEVAFQKKNDLESEILKIKSRMTLLEKEIKQVEISRKLVGTEFDECKSTKEKLQLEDRSLEAVQEEIIRTSNKHNVNVDIAQNDLVASDSEESLEMELNKVLSKIDRLGPLNLAAIEEFSQLEARKSHLDKQNKDLEKALDNLTVAIRKIDNETKSRFKEIFEKINKNLTGTFEKLFGGGSARLVLTEDNLLETGVTVLAQPPGKRNTTISQLSGGEKALTALSILFTIFSLKPSPFCLLDEVDAPLDDSNVARYAEMIAEMSSSIQFLFVTHNKLTMEIADQLVGITMEEAGVSRLVSVDVPKALKLVDSA